MAATRTASVRKRNRAKGPVYEARWRYKDPVTGTVTQHGSTFSTEAEARTYLRQKQHELETGSATHPAMNRLPVRQVADEWLEVVANRVRPTTWVNYERVVRLYLTPTFGDRRIGSVRAAEINHWLTNLDALPHRKGRAVPVATMRYAFYVAQATFQYALKHSYIMVNPCAAVDFPTNPPDAPAPVAGRFVERDDVERLADALAKEETIFGLFVRFAATTGLRQSEMAGLRVGDVDLDRRTIRIARTASKRPDGTWVVGEPKTRHSTRTVPVLDDDVATALQEHMDAHPRRDDADATVFPALGRSGLHYDEPWDAKTWYRRHFRPALKAAGLPFAPRSGVRWHDLRHSAGSQWIADGFPLETVSDWLGHGSINFTRRVYVHAPRVPDYSAAIERSRVAKEAWKARG